MASSTEQELYEEYGQDTYENTDAANYTSLHPQTRMNNKKKSMKYANEVQLEMENPPKKAYVDYRANNDVTSTIERHTVPKTNEKNLQKPLSISVAVRICIVVGIVCTCIGMGAMYGISSAIAVNGPMPPEEQNIAEENLSKHYIPGKNDQEFRIHMTSQGENASVTIPASPTTSYAIPTMEIFFKLNIESEETIIWNNKIIAGKADSVMVTSNANIFLVTHMLKSGSLQDSFLVLPESALGLNYVVNSRGTDYLPSLSSTYPILYILNGNYESTILNFSSQMSDINTHINKYPGQSYSMGAYTQLTISGSGSVQDYTGMIISASNPVAIVSCYVCFYLSSSSYDCNTVCEQFLPQQFYGTEFLIPKFSSSSSYTYNGVVRVVAIENATNVEFTHGTNPSYTTKTLNAGTHKELQIKTESRVTCSKPCSVTLHWNFIPPSYYTYPSMTIIPGTNLFKTGPTYFSANMTTSEYQFVYLAIVTKLTGRQEMTLDGKLIGSTWQPIFKSDYEFTCVEITERKSHLLNSVHFPYMAYLYGGYKNSRSFSHPIVLNFT